VARLWKTKYPLVVRKIGEYATGLPGKCWEGRFRVSLRDAVVSGQPDFMTRGAGSIPVLKLDFQSVSPGLLWPYASVQQSSEGLDDEN
jgi:hypothetical protein